LRRIEQGDWVQYATIVLRFLDSPTAPFSIHKIALEGQKFGKQVGEWFGPGTISQVLKSLAQNDADCQLAVHVAQDGILFKNEARLEFSKTNEFGQTPKGLLILINILLGLDQLNPLYHPLIKVVKFNQKCFDLPSFVGIGGGRPNSSLYFIGYQGDHLIYLDPHYMRQSIFA
jgi:cysteine protease ATG4